MSNRRYLVYLLLITLFIAFNLSGPVFAQENPPARSQDRTAGQEDQDKDKQQDDTPQPPAERRTGLSTMDLLREKITGVGATAVTILASGSTEISGDWMTIQQNAEIKIGLNKSLLADKILYNPKENILRAEGNVVLLENKLRIGGDSLDLNLDDNTGVVVNPFIESQEGFYVAGTKLEKLGPDMYKLSAARITTCTQPTPQWRMVASSITIKAGEWASLRNMRLNMMDTVPVFYMPWMRIPLDRERGSGFLMPEFGNSDQHGFWLQNRYFWAINDSHDATLGLDYYEERGNRYSVEYRNDLGNGNVTFADFYFIEDTGFYQEADRQDEPRNRYSSTIVNRTNLPWNFSTNVNLEFLGDNTYRRDFINRDVYYNPMFSKSAALLNNTGPYGFAVSYYEVNRFRTRNRLSQIQYLPRVTFNSREQQIAELPLFVSFSSDFVRPHIKDVFRRAEFDREDLITDEAYNRLDLQGEIKAPIKALAPWFTITPRFLGRSTNYSRSYDDETAEYVDEEVNRRYWDAGVDAVGPIFSKIYGDPSNSSFLLKHVIEPNVSYLYRSEIDQDVQDRIIILDQEDTFFRVHELRWTLSNIFYYKSNYPGQPERSRVFELLRVAVTQFVSMEDDLLTSYDKRYVFDPGKAEVVSRFSPLTIDMTARLGNALRANARIEYDAEENSFINYTLGGGLNTRNIRLNIGWYRSVGVVRFDRVGVTRSQANRFVSNGSLTVFDGLIQLRGAFDYDFERERVLNYLGGITISGQCLGAGFELRKLNILGVDDMQTRFSIVIGGLGSILGGGNN